MLPRLSCVLVIALAGAGCGPTADDGVVDPSDLEWDESGAKGDGSARIYNPNRVVPQDAFEHDDAFTASQVQQFLESTPYDGRRSFLADVTVGSGTRFSQAVVDIADAHDLNPLVLLVTLQKESGLVSKSTAPNRHRVDFAFGCGCPDGQDCMEQFRGIDKQLICSAELLRAYLDEIDTTGATRAGWAPGKTKSTLDPISVTPKNRATAALYTYTPWSLRGQGGNWLFWNVWNRYSDALDYRLGTTYPFNEGFIGGACSGDADCAYSGGECVFDGNGNGTCSMACERSCPDSAGATTTFCITSAEGTGMCVAQCGGTTCGPNQVCVQAGRHNEPNTLRDVCVPAP